jgi:hypothetical protein
MPWLHRCACRPVIRIDGAGKRFSGQHYVTSALHSYTRRDGYLTQFQVRRNAW